MGRMTVEHWSHWQTVAHLFGRQSSITINPFYYNLIYNTPRYCLLFNKLKALFEIHMAGVEPREIPVLIDRNGKELPKDLQEVNRLIHQSSLILHDIQGDKLTLDQLLANPVEEILVDFWHENRNLTLKNYRNILSLAEICNHIETKYYVVKAGARTQLRTVGSNVYVICQDMYEQFGTKCYPGDRIRVETEGGSVVGIYAERHAQSHSLLLEFKKASDTEKISGKLLRLSNIQNDDQVLTLMRKIRLVSDQIVQFMLVDGHKVVIPKDEHEDWEIDETELSGKHLDFVRGLAKLHYEQPFVFQGCYGAGKSHAQAHLVKTYVEHKPNCKILVAAANNAAIDSLMLKIQKKAPDAVLARYYSGRHEQNLPESFSWPGVGFKDHTEAVDAFVGPAQVLGATISKIAKLGLQVPNMDADLILLDEAGTTREIDVPVIMHSFWKEGKTNVVLAGDIFQQPALICSKEARALGLQVSSMKRLLMNGGEDYKPDRPGDFFPTVMNLDISFRCPPQLTRVLGPTFYPWKIYAQPDEKKYKKYVNLANMPKGHIIFHNIPNGTQERYSNQQGSLSNGVEADVVIRYCEVLIKGLRVPAEDILIISYYTKQNFVVDHKMGMVQLCTTETEDQAATLMLSPSRSQGTEKPIVLVTTVQAGKGKLGDHLRDDCQNLVALSRCSSLLIVLGCKPLLEQHPNWRPILRYAINTKDVGKKFLVLPDNRPGFVEPNQESEKYGR